MTSPVVSFAFAWVWSKKASTSWRTFCTSSPNSPRLFWVSLKNPSLATGGRFALSSKSDLSAPSVWRIWSSISARPEASPVSLPLIA